MNTKIKFWTVDSMFYNFPLIFVCRERLGLDVDAVVRVDGVLAKYKADQLKLNDITQQLEATTNIQLTLKVQVG